MDQRVRLEKLCSLSESFLSRGYGYYTEATETATNVKKRLDHLDRCLVKVDTLHKEIHKQMQGVSSVSAHIMERNKNLAMHMASLIKQGNEVLADLHDVFDKLKEHAVHQALEQDDGKTLFDYVDTDSIGNLETHLREDMVQFEEMIAEASKYSGAMEKAWTTFKDLTNTKPLKVLDRGINRNDFLSQLTTEVDGISNTYMQIGGHCDRLKYILKEGDSVSEGELAKLQLSTDEMPAKISQMYDRLQRICVPMENIERKIKQCRASYQNAATYMKHMEDFGRRAEEAVAIQSIFEKNASQRQTSFSGLYEELANLQAWYTRFFAAYQEMLGEVARRYQEHIRHEQIAAMYQQELLMMHEDESQRRAAFFENHGRYLPPSLCPALMEEPPLYKVHPREVPIEFTEELVRLSLSHAEQTLDQKKSEGATQDFENAAPQAMASPPQPFTTHTQAH